MVGWLLVALAVPQPAAEAAPADAVTLSVTAPLLVQCEPSELPVRVVNDTGFPVLLDRLSVPAAAAALDWSEQVYGELRYDEKADRFVHNQMAQMACPLLSARALLAPGAEAQLAVPLSLADPGPAQLTVRLQYVVVDSGEVARHVYLLRDESPLQAEYAPARLRDLREPPSLDHPGGGRSHLITRDLPEPRTIEVEVTVEVARAAFPLEEALAATKAMAKEYDSAGQRWFLETPAGLWVVARDRVDFTPGIGLAEHHFLASADPVPFWVLLDSLPGPLREKVSQAVARYEPEEAMGLHFSVPAGDVPALGLEMSRLGLRLVLSDFQLQPVLTVRPAGPQR